MMPRRVVLTAILIVAGADVAAADCFQRTEGIVVEGAVWSPDQSSFAFHSGSDIYTIPVAGGPMTKIVNDGTWATWSPDGTRLAYARTVGGNPPDIWVIDLKTGALQQITSWPGTDTYPDWSHDGDRIAYRSTRDDHVALYVFSFSNGQHARLTTLEGSFPDWSPNDDQITCERNSGPEGADILIVDYPSGVERQLFAADRWLRYPRWHPHGDGHPYSNSIIMIGGNDDGGSPAAMVYRLPSGPLMNVVCCLDNAAFPEWAPDGVQFSLTEAGDLMICTLATPVSQATWGAVKARFGGNREPGLRSHIGRCPH